MIRPIDSHALDAFLYYLEDHLKDNGRNGVPLFQPQSRDAAWSPSDHRAPFATGLRTSVGEPNWRRAWAALDVNGAIIGHVDLRAHHERGALHRALLGVGVHRAHRRRGLGRTLVEHALSWAHRETELGWIDLTVLAGNGPAERMYEGLGFQRLVTVVDMFRIDGAPVDNVLMTRPIHR